MQIVIVDYFFVKKGNIHTPSLFNPAAGSLYYYNKGWNVKALGCWISAAAFGIPGLIGAYHPAWVSHGAIHMYQTGWVICFAVATTFYFMTNRILPARVAPEGYNAEPKKFEQFAETDGYLEGDQLVKFRTLQMQDGEEPVSGAPSTASINEVMKDVYEKV
jgi:nucleobase:cation symporter-1, NCS1 family